MKTRFQFVPYSLELKEPFGTAHGTRTHTDGMLVSLEKDGVTGYGEVFMPPYYPENQTTMAAFFQKVDANVLLSHTNLDAALDFVASIDSGNSGAKTALDIALHDLFCKERSVSVSDLYGDGEHRGRGDRATRGLGDSASGTQHSVLSTQYSQVTQYSGSTQYSTTSFTIGIDTIETMVRKAREANGFETLKIKLNGDNDVSVIEAIRKVTDQQLFVDANQAWSDVDQAIKTVDRLIDLGVGLIEQPFPKGEAEKAGLLKENCRVPVVADEDVQTIGDIEKLAEFYDGINIKLMKAGGIREAYKMIETGRKHGLKILLGCMTESSIGISASAQLAHLADWCDLDGNLLIKNDTCTGVKTIGSVLRLGEAPGIGITDDSKLIAIFERDN